MPRRSGALWSISSPSANQQVGGVIPILGTADFTPDRVQFFKVEIGRGAAPGDWITLGQTHQTPVVDGQLEMLVASAFEPGAYTLRLVLVGWDGNYVGEPAMVTFQIE